MLCFRLEDEEYKKFNEWDLKHRCPFTHPNNQGAIGGRLTFSFTGTSLGQICKIKCACGEELDATDYSDW